MAHKAGMSEVKFKVRHNALLLREFTVEQMVRATGLKPESVRTELQRMRQEGLLTSEPLAEKRRGRGGRPALYKLTPDPEKRLALSREVESFFPEPPQPTQPTSRHYLVASRILDRIAAGQYKDDRECEALLQEARDHLDFAWYDEGEPQGLIRAYIDHERARLEYLCGNDETAEALFRQIRETFATAELHDEVAKVDEYLTCIPVRRQLMRLRRGALTPQGMARSALEALQVARSLSLADRPLVALLTELLESLAAFTRDQVLAEAQAGVGVLQARISETIRSEVRGAIQDLGERRPPFEEPETGRYPEARPSAAVNPPPLNVEAVSAQPRASATVDRPPSDVESSNIQRSTFNGDKVGQVMLQFQDLMSRFLETQGSVMLAYLQGAPGMATQVGGVSAQEVVPDSATSPLPASARSKLETLPGLPGAVPAAAVTEPPPLSSIAESDADQVPAPDTSAAEAVAGSLPDKEQLTQQLLRLVSEQTGYPPEMLDLDVDIEADLGIDPIKRVEILSVLRRACIPPNRQIGQEAMEQLTGIKTLRGVVDWIDNAWNVPTFHLRSSTVMRLPVLR